MNKTIFKAIAFLALFLIAAQVSAFYYGEIEIDTQNQDVFMSRNDNVGVVYSFINTSNERKCVDVSIMSISPYIDASFPQTSFCLNAGEKTQMALSLKTTDAPKADYRVFIILKVDTYSYNFAIANITVGDSPSLEINPYPTDICRGKDEYINVLVKNRTPFFQTVKLNAENEMLLPYFAQEEIFLDSFQEKNVKLYVNTNDTTRTGPETVSIYATTMGDYIKKISQINVKDCQGIQASNFEVTMSSSCSEIEKTKLAHIYFTVRNLSDSDQTINFAVLSDLPNYLGTGAVTLGAFEQRTFSFDVNARISDSTGDHNASLIVWNQNNRIEKSVCIRVKPTDILNISLLKNKQDIKRCETGTFVFVVDNAGDRNQRIDFNASNIPANVNVSFSDKNFWVDEKEQRETYMYVSVAEAAALGNYDLNIVIKAKSKTFQQKVSFNVIEKASGEQKGLLIESYPLQIQATENSGKTITIKLRNSTESIMDNVQLSIKNLPEKITSSTARNISLNPSETKNINLSLAVGKIPIGTYKALLEAKNGSTAITKEIEIVIGTAEATGTTGTGTGTTGLTGLFGLGGNIAWGLLIIIVVLLVAIALIGLVAPRGQRVWTRH